MQKWLIFRVAQGLTAGMKRNPVISQKYAYAFARLFRIRHQTNVPGTNCIHWLSLCHSTISPYNPPLLFPLDLLFECCALCFASPPSPVFFGSTPLNRSNRHAPNLKDLKVVYKPWFIYSFSRGRCEIRKLRYHLEKGILLLHMGAWRRGWRHGCRWVPNVQNRRRYLSFIFLAKDNNSW